MVSDWLMWNDVNATQRRRKKVMNVEEGRVASARGWVVVVDESVMKVGSGDNNEKF